MSGINIVTKQVLTVPKTAIKSRAEINADIDRPLTLTASAQQPFKLWSLPSVIWRQCIEWARVPLAVILAALLVMPGMAQAQTQCPSETTDTVDSDCDGLIDITTPEELYNVRFSLDGSSYKTSADGPAQTKGCPNDTCSGYELMNNLNFDIDDDGEFWSRADDGTITWDAGDNRPYFETTGTSPGGWEPIGSSTQPFNATFDGKGHTISNLVIHRNLTDIGLFAAIGPIAEIRNLGLTNILVEKTNPDPQNLTKANIGGLAGQLQGGSITATWADVDAYGGAASNDAVGGLVGLQSSGSITSSWSTGNAHGGAGNHDRVGGLVGQLASGSVTGSYATGNANVESGNISSVGGLVGYQGDQDGQNGGHIVASWAIGNANGGTGDDENVGGLVGQMRDGNITASYATGAAMGGAGGRDHVGGLVGQQYGGSITASWAGGDATGNAGTFNYAGGLVGRQWSGNVTSTYATGDSHGDLNNSNWVGALVGNQINNHTATVTASWGYGSHIEHTGLNLGLRGSQILDIETNKKIDNRPSGATTPDKLTYDTNDNTNVPDSWNIASSNSLGAWDFGGARQNPALKFADYDGPTIGSSSSPTSGGLYHCANDGNAAPDNAIIIPNCGKHLPSITLAEPAATTARVQVTGAIGVKYYIAVKTSGAALNAAAIKSAARGGSIIDAVNVTIPESGRATLSLTGLTANTSHDAYIVREISGILGSVTKLEIMTDAYHPDIDFDNDGLIDIYTLEELHNIRFNLAGTSYKASDRDPGNSSGCPSEGCNGYELMNDLSLDHDGDGTTWTRANDGTITLDAGDSDDIYFNTAAGGWTPIGDCGTSRNCRGSRANPLKAEFEGNNRTIYGVATHRDFLAIGFFGTIGTDANISNLNLEDNLVANNGNESNRNVGGLVGFQDGGTIISSRVTGVVIGSSGNNGRVGGLVGRVRNVDVITGSQAMGNVYGGAGSSNRVGGLVGFLQDSAIIDSHATGNVYGGSGGNARVGGLVGMSEDSSITVSHATGNIHASGGDNSHVGGLVGEQKGDDSAITASWSSGNADGGAGNDNYVGALVGLISDGSITATWTSGDAYGGAGTGDYAGGLVGQFDEGSITASWSLGDANSGTDTGDYAGKLVGNLDCSVSSTDWTITSSWGFGNRIGEHNGCPGSDDLPSGVVHPKQLTADTNPATDVPSSWNQAGRKTDGAWDLGMTTHNPALKYSDYDGPSVGNPGSYTSGHLFHCASDEANAPDNAILIPSCGSFTPTISVLPKNNTIEDQTKVSIQVAGIAGTAYMVVLQAGSSSSAPSAEQVKEAPTDLPGYTSHTDADIATDARTILMLSNLTANTPYDIYIVTETGSNLGSVTKLTITTAPLTRPVLVNAVAPDYQAGVRALAKDIVFNNIGGASLTGCSMIPDPPQGLSVSVLANKTSCQITGTPSVTSPQTTYTVTATNAIGDGAATVNITVGRPECSDTDFDVNDNGLIDICSLPRLNNVRYNLAGTGYKTSGGPGDGNKAGCPDSTCIGYELLEDLNFISETDSNTRTWSYNSDDEITLDEGDNHNTYFAVSETSTSGIFNGGWVPIGHCGVDKTCGSGFDGDNRPFTSVFDGNGYSINDVAIYRDLPAIGLFQSGTSRGQQAATATRPVTR